MDSLYSCELLSVYAHILEYDSKTSAANETSRDVFGRRKGSALPLYAPLMSHSYAENTEASHMCSPYRMAGMPTVVVDESPVVLPASKHFGL